MHGRRIHLRRPTTRSRSRSASSAACRPSLDGEAVQPLELVDRVSTLAGSYGVGRIDHVEDRLVGIKSREIYEAPAATVLHAAHHALETPDAVQGAATLQPAGSAPEMAQAIYDGLWFSALQGRPARLRGARRSAMSQARSVCVSTAARRMVVGPAQPGARSTTNRWPLTTPATLFDHASAVGFINLLGPARANGGRHVTSGVGGTSAASDSQLLASLPVTVTDPTSAEESAETTTASVG